MAVVETADLEALRDPHLPTIERVIAARRLAAQDSQAALHVLVQIAQNEHESEWLCFAAGEAIAEILIRSTAVDDVPLHNFTGGAYLGYDEAVARHQRATS